MRNVGPRGRSRPFLPERILPILLVSGAALGPTVTPVRAGPLPPEPVADAALTFERHVRPILKIACFHCHGEGGEAKGDLDVRLVRLMRSGGRSGPSIVAGDAEASVLYQRLASDEMPKGEKKLAPEEKEIVRRWIDAGARTARAEPANADDARFTLEELEHWAFQPVVVVPVPRVDGQAIATPVDAFIAQGLARAGVLFSPEATRRSLLRRVTFDLTGLPPTPREVEDFLGDTSPDAWARVVDRLLASPQFGVRQARHWLDIAGYAETDGASDADTERPNAWRYRDYVIDSFNAGKPVDQFYREQLAGDELLIEARGSAQFDVGDPRHLELLTATGFLRMAPDATQSSNTLAERNSAAAASMSVVSTSLMGLTVGCAQCHDHKYDPISIDDYYRFRAVFDPAFPLEDWRVPSDRLVDMTLPSVHEERARIEAEAKRLDEEWNARRLEVGRQIQDLKLADVPADVRDAVRVAAETEPNERDERQRSLLETYPMVKSASFIAGFLVEYDGAQFRKFEDERGKITELRATMPPLRLVMATTERRGVVPVSAVFLRGDPESPVRPVSPAELTVLRQAGPRFESPVASESSPTTGRRIAYARQLTDGEHPLTARVFVNRVWRHLLGRGIVATPSDFGLSGARPSHPELLDWLARDFVDGGWDVKRLYRTILHSTTYRQESRRREELDAIDPENALFGRASLRRLEAEAIRDAILAVSGKLGLGLGGPSARVSEDAEGKMVLAEAAAGGGGAFRRSVFIQVRRRDPLDMLVTFDQPEMTPSCDVRRHSTVATQALWFLNDDAIVRHSTDVARLVVSAHGETETRLEALFVRLFAAEPDEAELRDCVSYLDGQRARFLEEADPDEQKKLRDDPAELEVRAWASLAQVLLASNRFLYVD